MSVYKVNSDLPPSIKIAQINDMVFELNGKFNEASMNLSEIDALYSGTGLSRKYSRKVNLGHNITGSGAWSVWNHWRSETGYSIWSIEVDNFADNNNNKLYLDDIALTYMGEASSLSITNSFNKVYTFNSNIYTDVTTEASTEQGTDFPLIWTTSDYVYIGDTSTFNKIQFVFNTVVSGYDIVVEYWNSSENQWKTLSTTSDYLSDTTEELISDGRLTFSTPDGWGQNTVNSVNNYWLRLKTNDIPVTGSGLGSTAYQITKADTVAGLLKLSNNEILDETWKWCYHETTNGTGSTYLTIRNDGASAYEGDYYIKSTSSDTNLQNYFVYNHTYRLDYQNSSYDENTALSYLYDVTDLSGEISTNDLVMFSGSGLFSGSGIHRATALTEGWFAGAVCKYTAGSGSNAKIQNFGKVAGLKTENKDNIVCGNRLWLSTGAGIVTNAAPDGIGEVVQLLGVAIEGEKSGTVTALLQISLDYSVNS